MPPSNLSIVALAVALLLGLHAPAIDNTGSRQLSEPARPHDPHTEVEPAETALAVGEQREARPGGFGFSDSATATVLRPAAQPSRDAIALMSGWLDVEVLPMAGS